MTRNQFLTVLLDYGSTLDTESEECNLNIDAPKGKGIRIQRMPLHLRTFQQQRRPILEAKGIRIGSRASIDGFG